MDALSRRLAAITAEADALWARSAASCRPGEIACRPGCIGCCSGLFAIGVPEALLVRGAVDELPDREREAVLLASRQIVEATAAAFPGDVASGLFHSDRPRSIQRFTVDTHAVPCPLLDLDGRCRIYDRRPLTCRAFGLALVEGGREVSPACALNFAALPARRVETGIAVADLRRVQSALDAAVVAEGWDPGAETTIPHALAGSAFA